MSASASSSSGVITAPERSPRSAHRSAVGHPPAQDGPYRRTGDRRIDQNGGMQLDRLRALPRPLAFVLPGGGALGAAQAGTLLALSEAQIEPDLLVGVSAGAVNAVLFAWVGGVTGARRLERMWRSLRRRDLLRVQPSRMALALGGRRPSLFDNRHGERFLRRQIGTRVLEHAPTRIAVVATDLHDGRPVALTEGDAASAVVASCAFPGVYPPVERGGRWLIDGGVVADVPLDLTADLGARSALVLSVPFLAPGLPRLRAVDLLMRASTFGVEAHGRTILSRPPTGLEVVEVAPTESALTTFAVGDTTHLIDETAARVRAWLRAPVS